jgi:tRNA(Ile)-lysidine synthase
VGSVAAAVAVAYSGGRDSTALLHATLVAAKGAGIRVLALHVNHGLSPNAGAWQSHCRTQCAIWAAEGLPVDFHVHATPRRPPRGASVEAWAREVRYAALRGMALAGGAGIVLLAHHRRDQAETWLLQALRGAGVAGLAGMPRQIGRDGIIWLRPWLAQPRTAIDAYVQAHRLTCIEDESNDDPRFARNRLRLALWPVLEAAFPEAELSLAAAAGWAQQAAAAIDEWTACDLSALQSRDGALRLAPWRDLTLVRQSASLRAWLQRQLGMPAPATLVTRLLAELPQARGGSRWPAGDAELRLHRGLLRHAAIARVEAVAPVPETELSVRRAGTFPLPGWGGRLRATRTREGGVPLAWLGRIELRPRTGGEQFQAGIGRPPRSLKKQYQSAGLSTWMRSGPLLYSGGQLVFVPGLGLDARMIGLPGQAMVLLDWLVDADAA